MIVLELGVGHMHQALYYWPVPASFVGVDMREMGYTHVVADFEQGLPFKAKSVGGIWSAHMFEHLSYVGAVQMLRECARVLSPGGELRLYLPNFRYWVEQYLDQGLTESVRDNIMGQQRYPTDFHLSAWDATSLRALAEAAGFVVYFVGTGRTPDELGLVGVRP